MNSADGLGVRRLTVNESEADRPTWSPPPFNEIAFAASTGPGYDIKVFEVSTGQTRQLTFGEGSNERPGVRAGRASPGLHVDAHRPHAGLHDWPRRTGPATDYARGQQSDTRVVELERSHNEDDTCETYRYTTLVVAVLAGAGRHSRRAGRRKSAHRTAATPAGRTAGGRGRLRRRRRSAWKTPRL